MFFVFWSACSTKLPHYVLPAYPALALLTGCLLSDWLRTGESTTWGLSRFSRSENGTVPLPNATAVFGRRSQRSVAITLLAVGIGLGVGVPIAAAFFAPGEESLGLLGLVPIGGAAAWTFFQRRGRARPMLAAFAATAVLFVTGVFAWAAVRVDRHQHAAPLLAAVRSQCPDEPQLAGYRYLQPSIVYYAGRPVPCLENPEQVRQFLAEARWAYLMTTQEHAEEFERQLPGALDVVAAQPRFLKRHETVVVLEPHGGFSALHTARRMDGPSKR